MAIISCSVLALNINCLEREERLIFQVDVSASLAFKSFCSPFVLEKLT